jgi:hypothetical protein
VHIADQDVLFRVDFTFQMSARSPLRFRIPASPVLFLNRRTIVYTMEL